MHSPSCAQVNSFWLFYGDLLSWIHAEFCDGPSPYLLRQLFVISHSVDKLCCVDFAGVEPSLYSRRKSFLVIVCYPSMHTLQFSVQEFYWNCLPLCSSFLQCSPTLLSGLCWFKSGFGNTHTFSFGENSRRIDVNLWLLGKIHPGDHLVHHKTMM